jgi:hypothetical protein
MCGLWVHFSPINFWLAMDAVQNGQAIPLAPSLMEGIAVAFCNFLRQ